MWLIAMFDLPVDTPQARKEYTHFRKALLREGFTMLQYSVYGRFFQSAEDSDVHRKHVRAVLPPDGQVRLVTITDKQFAKMEVFEGPIRGKAEPPPAQMMLF